MLKFRSVLLFAISLALFPSVDTSAGFLRFEKIHEIMELDSSAAVATLLRAQIHLTVKKKELVFMRMRELRVIHPVTREAALAKLAQRVARLKEEETRIRSQGEISLELQQRLIPSEYPMRVLEDRGGNHVIFDGNGRYEAIQRAFPDADLRVEVERWDIDSSLTRRTLAKLLRMRGLQPAVPRPALVPAPATSL